MAAGFKSKAQIARCEQLVKDGKMTQEYFDECMRLTHDSDKLPERLHPKREKKEKKEGGSGDEEAA